VGEWYKTECAFGIHMAMRFDVVEKGPAQRSMTVWVDADLTGGAYPSQLYSWISALEFDGKALPEGYSLKKACPLLREAWATIEAFEEGPLLYNRILRLSPFRGAKDEDVMPAQSDHPGTARQDKHQIQ
jgi:hypothetical protein